MSITESHPHLPPLDDLRPRFAHAATLREAQGERLRVALVAGTLARGGAEKQLVHTVRALQQEGVEVRVYCLTRGEYFESVLSSLGLDPVWFGWFSHPALRLTRLGLALARFRPHIIQATHCYTNLYVALLAPLLGSLSVGALRSSLRYCRAENGRWTRWLLTLPQALIVNSQAALQELTGSLPIPATRIFFLPNAVDLPEYDAPGSPGAGRGDSGQATCTAAFVGRLVPVKCVHRFVRALALARIQVPSLMGIIVGEGPERASLQSLACELGLSASTLAFLGARDDVARLLQRVDMLILCSDEEGLPNVILEAMAARVPVITTAAGDAPLLVRDGATGYVVPFDSEEAMAAAMVRLAHSPQLRQQLGDAGRRCVEDIFSTTRVATRLLSIYRAAATEHHNTRLLNCLDQHAVLVSPKQGVSEADAGPDQCV